MSETQALATFDQNQALAALGYGADDIMRPAKLELLQPIQCTDPESGKVPGLFMDVKTKDTFKKMRIVPLYIGGNDPGSLNARVCFGSDEMGSKPICRSNNGVLPVISDDIVRQDGGAGCKKCPKSQWKKIGTKWIKAQCMETIKFVFVDAETGFPYVENVKKNNLAPLRDLRETLRKKVMMSVARKQPTPLYGFAVNMTSTKITKNGKVWFIHDFGPVEPVADPTEFGPIFEALVVNRGVDLEAEPTDGETAVNQVIDGQYEEA